MFLIILLLLSILINLGLWKLWKEDETKFQQLLLDFPPRERKSTSTSNPASQQTRKQSLLESILNVFSGMVIAFAIKQLFVYLSPLIQLYLWSDFDFTMSVGANAIMTVVLTIVSISRGYAWRRYFNNKLIKRG